MSNISRIAPVAVLVAAALSCQSVSAFEVSATEGQTIFTGGDTVTDPQITASSTGDTPWVGYSWGDGPIVIGSDASEVTLKAADTASTYGASYALLAAGENSTITVNGKNLTVEASSDQTSADVQAICAANLTTNYTGSSPATIIINAENTTITASAPEGATAAGLVAMSQGIIKVNGNLKVTAPHAITARGGALVEINKDGTHTVDLTGDINFDYDKATSGTPVDATVDITFGEGSSWTGNAKESYSPEKPDEDHLGVTGLSLKMEEGSVWNVTPVEADANQEQVAIPKLEVNGAEINLPADAEAKIVSLSGSGATVNAVVEKTGDALTAGKLSAEESSSGTKLTVNAKGITSDDLGENNDEVKTAAEDLIGGIAAVEGASVTGNIEEGDVIGKVTVSDDVAAIGTNTVFAALGDLADMGFVTMRSQANDLDKRMGDLRTMPKADGAWARVYNGRTKLSGKSLRNDYTTLQIGADHRFGNNVYLGATGSWTNNSGRMANGSADGHTFNFGVYGGWLGDDGQFLDVIVKRHRTTTGYALSNLSGVRQTGSYHQWATTASVEYGWRLSCPSTSFYAEPQAELILGHQESASHTNSRGVKVRVDSADSVVGRLGVAAGYKFAENRGSAYAKASVLHEFKGDTEVRSSKDGVGASVKDDLSGTWGEFAIGGTYNFKNRVSVYGEVETMAGSPIRNPWQVSAGVRYSF